MGKSGSRKKKTTVITPSQNQNQVPQRDNDPSPVVNGAVNVDSSLLLKRAHELKEEGNKRFQFKDYLGALQQYESALKLTPKTNPDRAVFHSNRAACLMQMKPIDYDTVISECSLALQVQPQYVRALLRRARAFEATGKHELAMQDVQALLIADPNHKDALEIAGRLRMTLGQAQPDLQSRPSPAALGASAVRGAPISGLGGPCLPARPVAKKPTPSVVGPTSAAKLYPIPPVENGRELKTQLPKLVLNPSYVSSRPNANASRDNQKEQLDSQLKQSVIRWRPLKLVYDHDIRLTQMPVNCSLKVLRNVVSERFPMSKAVLIKYKDNDGDLVTITCNSELKMAESWVDNLIPKDPDSDKSDSISMLRLHIVEVSPEQEPTLPEEEEQKKLSQSESDSSVQLVETEIDNPEKFAQKEKPGLAEDSDSKEVEMDDWLFEFAHLFRTHVGVDPDAHIDLNELGMELCSEALEETVTSEEAQKLFDKAALKFQEVAALAFFNWGNVHMCAARKKIPIDESSQLQIAYDWVMEKYSLAKEKYDEALMIKPDFYEGLLALGQQQFEMAKLHWSFVLAKKADLSKWDWTETLGLFDSVEEKMKAATEMWERMEEQRVNDSKDNSSSKKDEVSKINSIGGVGVISPEAAAEQAAVMRSQIHLFWGNMLFERSQVECKLGLPGWEKNLDVAVERFKLAGASEGDISTVLKNHCSKEEGADGGEKKGEDRIVNGVEKRR